MMMMMMMIDDDDDDNLVVFEFGRGFNLSLAWLRKKIVHEG
jgi:hypothetical protein